MSTRKISQKAASKRKLVGKDAHGHMLSFLVYLIAIGRFYYEWHAGGGSKSWPHGIMVLLYAPGALLRE